MKYYYTYRIDDLLTGNFYYGSRQSDVEPELDSYMGSPVSWAREATYNPENQVKTILQTFDTVLDMRQAEKDLIADWIKHPKNKNGMIPGVGFYTKGPLSSQTKKKMSESKKGKKASEETRAKLSKLRKGIPLSPEHREKTCKTMLGKKHTPEARAKMSEAAKQRTYGKRKPLSEEHKLKISETKRQKHLLKHAA